MLEVGSPAPEFELRDQHGRLQRLADRRGHPALVVFYPMAFTGVCTGEIRALQDCAEQWRERETDVVAISCDSVAALRAFAEEQHLDITLLSDFWPHGAVASSYGVFDETLGIATRGSFIIDEAGIVQWTVHHQIPDARNVEDYLEAIDALAKEIA